MKRVIELTAISPHGDKLKIRAEIATTRLTAEETSLSLGALADELMRAASDVPPYLKFPLHRMNVK